MRLPEIISSIFTRGPLAVDMTGSGGPPTSLPGLYPSLPEMGPIPHMTAFSPPPAIFTHLYPWAAAQVAAGETHPVEEPP